MGRIEQRLSARFNIEVAAEVYTKRDVIAAGTRNLSATGACLDLHSVLEEGSVVGISLFFTSDGIEDPDSEPLNLRAKVVWCAQKDSTSWSAGVRFEEMDENKQMQLTTFLATLGA
jgi:c-di-GMP-binding flagellar brake protein YcgR